MPKQYKRSTGKAGVVVAAKINLGDLEESYVLRGDGTAKGVKPEMDYFPNRTYVKCVDFVDGLPVVEAISQGEEPIGLLVSQPRGNIPTTAKTAGEYILPIADVEFAGNKIVTVPLADGIEEDIECHESLELANSQEYTKAENPNNTRVLEPRKATDENIKQIAILTGFTGVM